MRDSPNYCRRMAKRTLIYASYFSASSSLSLSSWTSSTAGALTLCGHCDNCTRDAETLNRRDVTLECWQILKIVQEVEHLGGRVTLGMLADLIRGAGGGSFGVVGNNNRKGKGKAKEKVDLDLDATAGGKVNLTKDVGFILSGCFLLIYRQEAETLLIHLLLSHYLKEDFHSTAYSINVYLVSGPQAMRLTRLTREAIQSGTGQKIEYTFLTKPAKRGTASSKGKIPGFKLSKENGNMQSKLSQAWVNGRKKRKRVSSDGEDSGDMDTFIVDDDVPSPPQPKHKASGSRKPEADKSRASPPMEVPDSDIFDDDMWIYNMADTNSTSAVKRTHRKRPKTGPGTDDEVVIVSE